MRKQKIKMYCDIPVDLWLYAWMCFSITSFIYDLVAAESEERWQGLSFLSLAPKYSVWLCIGALFSRGANHPKYSQRAAAVLYVIIRIHISRASPVLLHKEMQKITFSLLLYCCVDLCQRNCVSCGTWACIFLFSVGLASPSCLLHLHGGFFSGMWLSHLYL